jgi:hypothetical protein
MTASAAAPASNLFDMSSPFLGVGRTIEDGGIWPPEERLRGI